MKAHGSAGSLAGPREQLIGRTSHESEPAAQFQLLRRNRMMRFHPMASSQHTKLPVAAWVATSLLLVASLSGSARAQGHEVSSETVSMIVVVKEADTGDPISQAHITLQF